jgi:hypothetical protein
MATTTIMTSHWRSRSCQLLQALHALDVDKQRAAAAQEAERQRAEAQRQRDAEAAAARRAKGEAAAARRAQEESAAAAKKVCGGCNFAIVYSVPLLVEELMFAASKTAFVRRLLLLEPTSRVPVASSKRRWTATLLS